MDTEKIKDFLKFDRECPRTLNLWRKSRSKGDAADLVAALNAFAEFCGSADRFSLTSPTEVGTIENVKTAERQIILPVEAEPLIKGKKK